MASVFACFGQPETFERESYAAYRNVNGYARRDCGNNVHCVAFSGAVEASAFSQTDTKFGVCKINENNDCFESMVDGTTRKAREPASVFKPALTKFVAIWKDLQPQVDEALATGKTVVFTGHNIGGGIANLATIASLEKWGKGASVFAITFGFPLIGDEILARAVRRQGWDNHLFNVVSSSDVFASTLLAPCMSVSAFLEKLLPYWQRSVELLNVGDTDILMEPADVDFKKYVDTVLQHACAVVNLTTVNNMEPANKLIACLKPAVELSPYRPFGYYLFCSEKGALFVENYEAVLPILFYSLASAQNEVSISDHTDYGKVFHGHTSMVNFYASLFNLDLEELQDAALSSAKEMQLAMEMQLDALGLGIQNTRARLALRAAGEAEQKLIDNRNKLREDLDNRKKLREDLAMLFEGARGKDAAEDLKLTDIRKKLREDLAKLIEEEPRKDAAEDLKLKDIRKKLREDLAKLFEGARGKDAAEDLKLTDNRNKLREDLKKLFEGARGKDAAEDLKLTDKRNKLREDLAKLIEGARWKDAAAHMTKLKEYRSNCFTQRNIGYYDAFREQKEKVDFQANLNRLNLAAFFDKVEEMVETHQVPDDIQFIEELIKEGTEYRLLVEPLDVANYYRLGKHEDSGHYMKNARPRRYKALEKWLADIKPQEKKMAVISGLQDITKDSCFWAHVEEVSWIMSNPKENAEVKRTECSEFQNYVKQLWDRKELCVEEVKARDSTFVKWWNKLSPQEKQASPIADKLAGP